MSHYAPGRDFRTVDLKYLKMPKMEKKSVGLICQPMYQGPDDPAPVQLCIQTPQVRMPYGLSDNTSMDTYQPGQPVKYNVDGSFDNYRTDPLMKQFHEKFLELENYAISVAALNSEAWFGQECDEKGVRMLFNRLVKVSKDKEKAAKYDPCFSGKVRAKKDKEKQDIPGEFWTTLRGIDGNEIPLSSLENRSKGSMKLKLSQFYVINGKFGWTWDIEWIRVTELPSDRVDDWQPNMYGEQPALPPPAEDDNVGDMYSNAGVMSVGMAGIQPVEKSPEKRRRPDEPDDDINDDAADDKPATTKKRIKKSSA